MTMKREPVMLPGWAEPLLKQKRRYKVMHGGRGGGKSWAVAISLLLRGAREPTRILCAREVQKSMRDSVHRLLKDQIVSLGLEWFYEVLDTEIRGKNGTLILDKVFRGRANRLVRGNPRHQRKVMGCADPHNPRGRFRNLDDPEPGHGDGRDLQPLCRHAEQ
jgi:hypothetical protein